MLPSQSILNFLGERMPKHQFVQVNPNPVLNHDFHHESLHEEEVENPLVALQKKHPFIQVNKEVVEEDEEHELGPGPSLLFAFNSHESFFTYQSTITFVLFLIIVITLMVGN